MKDDNIKSKVIKLRDLVKEVNELMSDLGKLNVDVRIGYIERKGDVPQNIHIWRIEEHNDYLTDE
jgi:soluble P-type ATPase